MGDWIKLIIPLIAVAVWILTNLAKNREEPRRQRTAPPPKPEDGTGPRRSRTPVEVDKFLEEVRRRREAAEGKATKPTPVPVARTVERTQRLPARPMPTSPGRPDLRPMPGEPIVAVVVPPPEPVAAASIGPPRVTAVPLSAQVQQTLALLRDPKSLVTAMLLREILEAPLCRRTRTIPAHRK